MPALTSQLDPRSADFIANADYHRALADELRTRLARAAETAALSAAETATLDVLAEFDIPTDY